MCRHRERGKDTLSQERCSLLGKSHRTFFWMGVRWACSTKRGIKSQDLLSASGIDSSELSSFQALSHSGPTAAKVKVE